MEESEKSNQEFRISDKDLKDFIHQEQETNKILKMTERNVESYINL